MANLVLKIAAIQIFRQFSEEKERRIHANDRLYNRQFNYANNFIRTAKYSLATFLPLNLFEQFQRLANFYFLCLMILQMIKIISSLTPVTTAVPLIGVLCLTAIKDAYDDYQRHKSDRQVNNRISLMVQDGRLVEERWSRVQVGDVIRMDNNQFVAADVLLLTTSEPNGLCFIETAELDGETNLKCRQCLAETADMGQDVGQLSAFDGQIVCETPNNILNKFEGSLAWKGKRYPLDNDLIVLRGCILRNTEWCYGVVIFAGKDTKLMQNSGKTKFKRTSIDRLLNFIIVGIVLFLLAICIFCMVACALWELDFGHRFQAYLPWDNIVPSQPPLLGASVIGLLVLFSYAIVLNTVVPISLYVSVEVIRFVQSFLINWDSKMYCERRKMAAKARTTTLNEELGQIQYIFSDKTGTLTRNIMAFNRCSVAGKCYGELVNPNTGQVIEVTESTEKVDFSANTNYEADFRFYDKALLEAVRAGDQDVHTFFTLLAVCHTVMAEQRSGKLEYQAQSPDEAALVSAARNFGFVFIERTPYSITVELLGKRVEYELLCILDFNNTRKRMSVIVRDSSGELPRLRVYCKGADSVIYERLKPGDKMLMDKTQEHLNKFAGEGLRTLCLAFRDLDETFFSQWKERHHEAVLSLGNREELLEKIYEEIEADMTLIGATAIEDKLQDGVQRAIANLSMAEIRIWVLTGDKQETAVNIGYSCHLLNDDMELFIVDGSTMDEVGEQLKQLRQVMRKTADQANIAAKAQTSHHAHFKINNNTSVPAVSIITFGESDYKDENAATEYALVMNGHSLVHALHPRLEKLFVEVSTLCKSVICCRVTPLQKAMVVEVIKKHRQVVTLAIGDGANDVSMIKAAHIGVGISGQEGNQAMLASDYSIAQFRFLERLLLVHGRWSYYRMCKFLRYFFYKNFAFTICHFWFAFFCGFSAQTVFDPMFIAIYNLFYTSLPVLAIGVFDQDVSDESSLLYPQLYTPGHTNLFFNKAEFLRSALHGFFASLIVFIVPYGSYKDGLAPSGIILSDIYLLGSAVATILVIVVTVQVTLDTSYWTIFNHITIWGSLASYFILDYGYNYIVGGPYLGALTKAIDEPSFWLMTALSVVILIVPIVAWRFYFLDVFPTLSDRVRLKQRLINISRSSESPSRTPSTRRPRRSVRSGYAFAHQEGFGRLITSGKIMRKVPPRSDTHFLGFHPVATTPTPATKQPQSVAKSVATATNAPHLSDMAL